MYLTCEATNTHFKLLLMYSLGFKIKSFIPQCSTAVQHLTVMVV